MLYIKDRDKFPLQLILREILIANTSNAASSMVMDLSEMDKYKQLVKYCTTVIATLPILCVYPFLQKYFVKGIMIGSVKG
jgi:putative aldouronate transport system permease protein